ncbi:hypothetical protein, partial [Brachyspira hyodysenteriae]|uniref:hypothetical protein n=1 Tax=Brachyspira hyodysenteriae TaxID=159 RepID=UPI0015C4A9F0
EEQGNGGTGGGEKGKDGKEEKEDGAATKTAAAGARKHEEIISKACCEPLAISMSLASISRPCCVERGARNARKGKEREGRGEGKEEEKG